MRWYIIHTYSGFERKVKESLESRVAAYDLQDKIGRVVIPTEPVTEIRGGKKYTTERAFLPGYVLVEMDMDLSNPEGQNLWHVVKSTPRVTGFLGAGNQPTPMSEDEVNSIIFRVAESKDKPRLKVKFEKNESVRITEGPFATFTGSGGRSERRPRDAEGDGHHLRALDAGGAGVRAGGESGVSDSQLEFQRREAGYGTGTHAFKPGQNPRPGVK